MSTPERGPLAPLALLFFKLGVLGFGGPAAHIAMMEDEVVERRGWIDRQRFLDIVGATSLIPGPNSTEIAIHLGLTRGGWRGLLLAGVCFIGPAVGLTTLLAWAYVEFGARPEAGPALAGVKPAVVAVVLGALYRLGRKAVKGWSLAAIAAAAGAAMLMGLSELPALLGGGILGAIALRAGRARAAAAMVIGPGLLAPGLARATEIAVQTAQQVAGTQADPMQIGAFFLKVGSVLYGSGYVLVAFLESEVVGTLGWLSQEQLLDAIAAGQLTPGPVLSTAAFVGYVAGGWKGAIAGAVGIFLPSFAFVLALHRVLPRLRENPWTGAFLDAVNASALALMAVVTAELALACLTTPVAIGVFAAAAVLVLRWKVNAAWLVIGGGAAGWLLL